MARKSVQQALQDRERDEKLKVNARVAALEDQVAGLEKGIHAAVAVIEMLKAQVADLHHRRRVSRQQATDQDPEWH